MRSRGTSPDPVDRGTKNAQLGDNYPISFGRYQLLRKIAQGGMAEIFLAQDKKGRIVAIKRILPHLAHEESFIRMFIDEARIVSHLDHPNIAGVYDQGKHQGYYFIAMEFVQGHSLLALSERAKSVKMPLPRGLLAFVVAELLGALGCAHSARDKKGRHLGIVHRDVTPQNVLISYDGEVKLVDFGVAKARARLTQTEAGFTKGKLSYMSPEQARGEELDGRSDLFSVGIILHEITTNSRLFNKEGPGGILGAIVNDPIPPPSQKVKDYPKALQSIVMQALDKDVDRRWQSAEEMRDALLRFGRKERPPPSKARLKDLVHDLFGDPESAQVIEAARRSVEATPASVKSAQIIEGASVRAKVRDDETRMFARPSESMVAASQAKVEITHDGVPAVSMPIPSDEVVVPEPEVPTRVRLARFLAALAEDLSHSWREHRKKWVLGLGGGFLAMALVLGFSTGAFASFAHWMSDAATKASEMRQAAGLGKQVTVDAGLRPTLLQLRTTPPGATVTVNGIGMGAVTPVDLTAPGDLPVNRELKIEFSLNGYRPVMEKITLFEGRGETTLEFPLAAKSGAIEVVSDPPGARIYINQKRTKHVTPATIDGLDAEAPINVKVGKKGFLSASDSVIVGDAQVRKLDFVLELDQRQVAPGRIDVDSTPSGCAVSVDGTFAGNTPLRGFEAKAGSHLVKVACEYYGEQTRSLAVWSGQSAKASFSLQPSTFGYLTIRPVPVRGSIVRINGQRVPLPVEFRKVVPGRHVITVSNPGLNLKREMTVNVGPDKRITRQVNLMR